MKIKSVKKVAASDWLNFFDIQWTDRRGDDRSWQFVSRAKEPKYISGRFEPADAVVVVPYHIESGKLVIIKEFRVPLGDFQYGFPAGLIEKEERIGQAATRELKEETGLDAERILSVSPPIYTTTGISDESVVMVYMECKGKPTPEFNTKSELIEVILVSQEEAKRLCTRADLKFDAKTWIELSHFSSGSVFSR